MAQDMPATLPPTTRTLLTLATATLPRNHGGECSAATVGKAATHPSQMMMAGITIACTRG
jgi:hypothetical protein